MSIGFVDSGIGGLTTLAACKEKYGCCDCIYIADTLNAPYGSLKKEFIIDRIRELCDGLKVLGANAMVLACNSSSVTTYGIDDFSLPVIRVLPPVERMLAETTGRVLLMSTPVTANSQYVKSRMNDRLTVRAMDGLAAAIERLAPRLDPLEEYLARFLLPFRDFEAIALGCTHYVFLEEMIGSLFPKIKLYQSNSSAALSIAPYVEGGKGKQYFVATGECDRSYADFFEDYLEHKNKH